jgi:RAT1-interacting protein
MKWWAQSFLVGVPKIICGFRDDDGVIHNLQTFRTVDIPRESQVMTLHCISSIFNGSCFCC